MFKLLTSVCIRSSPPARSVVAQHYKKRLASAMAGAGELDERILTKIGDNQEQNVKTKEVKKQLDSWSVTRLLDPLLLSLPVFLHLCGVSF